MMRHAATIPETGVSAEELRQLRIGLRDGFGDSSQIVDATKLEQILTAYLGYLQSQLLCNQGQADIGQVQEMLLEVASAARAGQIQGGGRELAHFVDGLLHIYCNGITAGGRGGFHQTVGDYAELLESVSQEFPAYDYNRALQQLFLYMNQMFESKQKDWVDVFESILSMPESIELVQLLKQECLPEIMEWVEGGAQNLFQIRTDLTTMLRKLEMRERLVRQQMERLQGSYVNKNRAGNIIELKQGKVARALSLLRRKSLTIQRESEDKRDLITLVDSNIQEFQDLMSAARRAFFIRLVTEQSGLESWEIPCRPAPVWRASHSADVTSLQIISS